MGIVQGNGAFDLGMVPNYQQLNRQRTVPFVNNHDTFRPILDSDGNYNGWNSSQQLGTQIEPNDPRLSVEDITVDTYEAGITVDCTITFLAYNISEQLRFKFDQANGLV